MTNGPKPGLLSTITRVFPLFGKLVVGVLHFTPVPAPHRVSASVLRDGRRMLGHMDDHIQRKVLFGVYESHETGVLAEHVRPGDLFVDVGANIGWFTTLASKMVGAGGAVVAFEPFPANAELLRRNAAGVGLGNVKIDVEGFEAQVLRGAEATLSRTRVVLIELNRDALEVVGSSPEELVQILTQAGLTDHRLIAEDDALLANLPDFSNLLAIRP